MLKVRGLVGANSGGPCDLSGSLSPNTALPNLDLDFCGLRTEFRLGDSDSGLSLFIIYWDLKSNAIKLLLLFLTFSELFKA